MEGRRPHLIHLNTITVKARYLGNTKYSRNGITEKGVHYLHPIHTKDQSK